MLGWFLPPSCYDRSGGQEVTLRIVERDVDFTDELPDDERIRLISAQSRLKRLVERFNLRL